MPSNKYRYGLPKSALRTKKTRRITTIEDILARDDVNGILAFLDKRKPDITDMVVIYFDSGKNRLGFQITEETLVSTATWMLESTKLDVLNSESEE